MGGWGLEAIMTDLASEFRAAEFKKTQSFNLGLVTSYTAGRPQTNGYVERSNKPSWRSATSPPSPAA